MASHATPNVSLWVEATSVDNLELPDTYSWETWFNVWLRELNPQASPIARYEVSLLLTDDATIQELNSTYRDQDKATDVLAFAAQETHMPGAEVIYQAVPMPLGDLIISVETAQRQRHDAAYSLTQELAWLAAHGLLHLLGWDHPDEASLNRMLDKQIELLSLIDLAFA